MPQFQIIRRPTVAGRLALRFIFVLVGVYATAGALALLLTRLVPFHPVPGQVVFPPAFWWTTGLLAWGSGCLQHAVSSVRRERQKSFRRSLLCALVAGTLFVGIQSYGLACLARNQVPDDAQTGANAFITMLAVLHAMHFALALMFLVWVTLNALGDRYDHEYSWGVTVCAWFWHGLGIVWVLILVVFTIATELRADMGIRRRKGVLSPLSANRAAPRDGWHTCVPHIGRSIDETSDVIHFPTVDVEHRSPI